MRIGIDARFLTHPQKGGFKTYTENLVAGLAQVDATNEYVLYLDRAPHAQTRLPMQSNFTHRIVPNGLPLIGMPWREQVSLARQVARDRVDLLHSPCLTAPLRLVCPRVVTIHDMIWMEPEKYSTSETKSLSRRLMQEYYRRVTQAVARDASMIITVSHAAKASIVTALRLAPECVRVTHEAAAEFYRKVDDVGQLDAARIKYRLPKNFVLAIGSADPRKNLTTAVHAYAQMPASVRQEFRMVIVWTHAFLADELTKQIENLGLQSQVQFLQNVPNQDLILLYNLASLFVFPSLYEGFGLPLLEAMQCGTPVIAANNSSIPEIVGESAMLVLAQDAPGMAQAMTQVLTDDDLRVRLAQKGLSQAAGFSWRECARQTIAGYEQALRNHAQKRCG